jgi:SNF2 family DNA or RNA helicase
MARHYEPWPYQQFAEEKIINLPNLGLFLDMGMGKTVVTLTALHELKYHRFAICKALVIAPKKVAEDTWASEAAKWDHLKHLRVSLVLGTAKQRIDALNTPADVYVIGRDNTQWLVNYYGFKWPFDTVVLDESSSFKNHQAKRFKALRTVRPKIKRMIELTGTPAPHGLMDLWAQVYLLDGGQRLGRTISVYRDMFFVPDKRSRTTIFSYKPKEGAEQAIYKAISDITFSLRAEDYLDLPPIMYQTIPVVLDAKARRDYDRLERDMILELVEDDAVITAATAGVLSGKLLQLCDGAVYDAEGAVQVIHNAKIEAFMETVEQLQGEHALVFYSFKHDLERIQAALAGSGLRVAVYTGADTGAAWNAGEIDILLAHPASCCYGLNLQQGGRHVIWFGLPQALELYQQANKRLHRQGQEKPVIVHHLVVKDGRDEDVMAALGDKDAGQERLLASLRVRIDKAMGG